MTGVSSLRTPRILLPIAAALLASAIGLVILRAPEAPAALPLPFARTSPSPTATPAPLVALVRLECVAAPASPAPSPPATAALLETCSGAVRVVGPTRPSSLDAWVESLDAQGRPFFACRARVPGDPGAGATLSFRTVCEAQPAAAGHRVRFTDGDASPVRTAAPGQ